MSKKTLFYIDDKETNLLLVKKSLSEDYNVITTNNPETAIEEVLDNSPDLILLDVNMPIVNGYDICRKIREENTLKNIPIAFLTAQTNLHDRLLGFESGGDAYITKPFDIDELKSIVLALLNRYHQLISAEESAESANSMVWMMMRNNSEIGEVIQYARALSHTKTEKLLLENTFRTLKNFNLNSTILVKTEVGEIVSRSDGKPFSLLEQELLQYSQSGERITCVGNKYLFCGINCIYLIKNMPIDDDGLTSRLRDHLAIMIESADACIELINYQHKANKSQLKAASSTQATVKIEFENIMILFDSLNKKAINNVEQLAIRLEESFLFLGLTEEQESQINGFIELAKDDIDQFLDNGMTLHEALTKISESLSQIPLGAR